MGIKRPPDILIDKRATAKASCSRHRECPTRPSHTRRKPRYDRRRSGKGSNALIPLSCGEDVLGRYGVVVKAVDTAELDRDVWKHFRKYQIEGTSTRQGRGSTRLIQLPNDVVAAIVSTRKIIQPKQLVHIYAKTKLYGEHRRKGDTSAIGWKHGHQSLSRRPAPW